MRKLKTILLRGVFFFVALQILNQSIDFDYLSFNYQTIDAGHEFDDIDNVAEYLFEKLLGNDQLISEEDDDSGTPLSKGVEKSSGNPLCYDQFKRIQIHSSGTIVSTWATGIDQSNKTCKGFLHIISPPPKS